MSLLPAGTSLRNFLPDLDDLMENPVEYLALGPVVFGPRRMYGLAALFAIPGVAFVLAYYFGKRDVERIALGVGMLIGSLIWWGWSLWARGHSLILHSNGVEVKYHDNSVWCPWALFHADGEPHVPDVDSPSAGLILPVAPDALPFIELRHDDHIVAHGTQVKAKQFVISGEDEVILTGRYEVASKDLGSLLLHLGQLIGTQLPRGAPPREAYTDEPEQIADPDPTGWITARATRLRFPPTCCSCGEPTIEAMRFEVWSRMGTFMRMFMAVEGHEITVTVPVCESCQSALRARQSGGASRGLIAGSLLGPAAGFAVWNAGWLPNDAALLALGLSAAGALLGFATGHSLSYRPPVELRDYSPTRGTIRIRFRNPEYAALVVSLMRQRRAR